jgi:beta-lactamase superfamily II metal-dependent hydrolase
MLTLEAIQAKDGDCLLLHYGSSTNPGLILIDGGSRGVYRDFLEKRLNQLKGSKNSLSFRMVIISHIDADHITGILDMFQKMKNQKENGEQSPWKVKSLWHNAFEKTVGGHPAAVQSARVAAASSGSEADLNKLIQSGLDNPKAIAVVASVKQGKDLQRYATGLTTINAETSGELVIAPETGKKTIKVDTGLTFTILGPHQAELDNLKKEWEKSKKRKQAKSEDAVAADYLNRTIPNLSSIVILAEEKQNGKSTRMLLTGDAGGDLILEGLEAAKLLDAKGRISVDVLKVQHHGSKHSVAPPFFKQVLAKRYVISGNGAHGIPNIDVLVWLSEARKNETFDVYMTNRKLIDKQNDYTGELDKFLKKEPDNHRYHFRADNKLSIPVE